MLVMAGNSTNFSAASDAARRCCTISFNGNRRNTMKAVARKSFRDPKRQSVGFRAEVSRLGALCA